jgi:hypothetical protein
MIPMYHQNCQSKRYASAMLDQAKTRTQAAFAWHIRRRVTDELFRRRYGVLPPPDWADLTGYAPILNAIESCKLASLRGDVLEIGVFLGGGTAKLCALFAKRAPSKKVIAVDIFDPEFDHTVNLNGSEMAKLYDERIAAAGQPSQRAIFDQITRGCPNLVVVAGDSTKVKIPAGTLCFAMIDGHHAPEYVRADFGTAWARLTPGGVIALHDYGFDLPDVTHTINALVGEHADEIARFWTRGVIAFLQRET